MKVCSLVALSLVFSLQTMSMRLDDNSSNLFYESMITNSDNFHLMLKDDKIINLIKNDAFYLYEAFRKNCDHTIIIGLIEAGSNLKIDNKFNGPNENCFTFAMEHKERLKIIAALLERYIRDNNISGLKEELEFTNSSGFTALRKAERKDMVTNHILEFLSSESEREEQKKVLEKYTNTLKQVLSPGKYGYKIINKDVKHFISHNKINSKL